MPGPYSQVLRERVVKDYNDSYKTMEIIAKKFFRRREQNLTQPKEGGCI